MRFEEPWLDWSIDRCQLLKIQMDEKIQARNESIDQGKDVILQEWTTADAECMKGATCRFSAGNLFWVEVELMQRNLKDTNQFTTWNYSQYRKYFEHTMNVVRERIDSLKAVEARLNECENQRMREINKICAEYETKLQKIPFQDPTSVAPIVKVWFDLDWAGKI